MSSGSFYRLLNVAIFRYFSELMRTPWSILSVSRRDINSWLDNNQFTKERPYSLHERDLLSAFEHPIRFAILLIILHFLLLALLTVLPDDLLIPTWGDWNVAEQLSHFSTVWTIQATMVALVYPIVISFVAVYLQRRPASDAYIQLYMLHSGSLPAGISSLVLIAVMGIQYFLMSTWGTISLPFWASVDTVWLVVNSFLTAFFLFRTFSFLRHDVQKNVVERYCMNVALPREVLRLHSINLLHDLDRKGWVSVPVPVPVLGARTSNREPKVFFNGIRQGEKQTTIKLSRKSKLTDVRLWPLRLAIDWWYFNALRQKNQQSQDQNSCPTLTVPMSIGDVYENELALAYVSNGPRLNIVQSFLLRCSVVLSSSNLGPYPIKLNNILEELAIEARSMAGKSDTEGFERSYRLLINLHRLMLKASLFKNEKGKQDSWALLQDTDSIFSTSLHENWSKHYQGIIESAIEIMANNHTPIRRLCYLLQHLEEQALAKSPVEIRERSLQHLPMMFFQLSKWWTYRIAEQGTLEHSHKQMASLLPPLKLIYEEVLSDFIAGWEESRTDLREVVDKNSDWDELLNLVQLNVTHIRATAKMLLEAVYRGDTVASEWLADSLSKWFNQGYFHDDRPYQLDEIRSFITVDDLKLGWSEFCRKFSIDTDDFGYNEHYLPVVKSGVFLAALKNYLTDIRLITIELLLDWYREVPPERADNSLAFKIVVGLLSGKQWKEGGDPQSKLKFTDYFTSKARQFTASCSSGPAYIMHFDAFVQEIARLSWPGMISSRSYTFRGRNDVSSLGKSQLELLAVLTNESWTISAELQKQLDIWFNNKANQFKKVDILLKAVNNWRNTFEELKPEYIQILKAGVRSKITCISPLEFVRQGLTDFDEMLNNRRQEVVNQHKIDTKRLREIDDFASKTAFGENTGRFPINLFPVITTTSRLEDFTLRFKQQIRGRFTNPPTEQVTGEEEYYSKTMAQYAANVVLSDILSKVGFREILVKDAESYWRALKSEAQSILDDGGNPILVLGRADKPNWIWDWQHADYAERYQRPVDLQLTRRKNQKLDYLFHLNEIAVFKAQIEPNYSLLLSSKLFQALSFTEWGNNIFVQTSVDEINDETNKPSGLIDLKLTFSRSVEIGEYSAVKLRYGQTD